MLHFAKEHYVEVLCMLGGFAWGWIFLSILNGIFAPIMRLFQSAKVRVERVPVPVRVEPTLEQDSKLVDMFKRRKAG